MKKQDFDDFVKFCRLHKLEKVPIDVSITEWMKTRKD